MSFYRDGVRFQCTRCSGCCRHDPGYVFLSGKDLEALAAHLGMTAERVLDRYCRDVDIAGIPRVSLKELGNYDCIFWASGKGCTVYEARPLQCRSFPFWAANLGSLAEWQRTARRCPGVGQGPLHTRRTIEKWLRRREREPFMAPRAPARPAGGPQGSS